MKLKARKFYFDLFTWNYSDYKNSPKLQVMGSTSRIFWSISRCIGLGRFTCTGGSYGYAIVKSKYKEVAMVSYINLQNSQKHVQKMKIQVVSETEIMLCSLVSHDWVSPAIVRNKLCDNKVSEKRAGDEHQESLTQSEIYII